MWLLRAGCRVSGAPPCWWRILSRTPNSELHFPFLESLVLPPIRQCTSETNTTVSRERSYAEECTVPLVRTSSLVRRDMWCARAGTCGGAVGAKNRAGFVSSLARALSLTAWRGYTNKAHNPTCTPLLPRARITQVVDAIGLDGPSFASQRDRRERHGAKNTLGVHRPTCA